MDRRTTVDRRAVERAFAKERRIHAAQCARAIIEAAPRPILESSYAGC